jgi:acyl phosphate:glycerol-3-phosphate acyltransferase
MQYFLSAILGYVFGSVPFGLLLTKAAGLGDVRNIGSGNIGATNVLRTGNKPIAIATLLCDVLKGTIPVLIATYFWGAHNNVCPVLAAFGAIAGHIFPVWLGFKGGKGVATLIGILFGLYWPIALIFLAVWLAFAFAFKFSSLAALASSMLLPIWALLLGHLQLAQPLAVLAVVVWIMHRANISRLMNGTETQISLSSKK